MNEKDIFRIGMCLGNIRMSLTDGEFEKIKSWVNEVQDIAMKYAKEKLSDESASNHC